MRSRYGSGGGGGGKSGREIIELVEWKIDSRKGQEAILKLENKLVK